jgi:hypothetical protein
VLCGIGSLISHMRWTGHLQASQDADELHHHGLPCGLHRRHCFPGEVGVFGRQTKWTQAWVCTIGVGTEVIVSHIHRATVLGVILLPSLHAFSA